MTGATASWRGIATTPAFAAAKMGQRGVVVSMVRDFSPQGIHIFRLAQSTVHCWSLMPLRHTHHSASPAIPITLGEMLNLAPQDAKMSAKHAQRICDADDMFNELNHRKDEARFDK